MAQKSLQFNEDEMDIVEYLNNKGNINKFIKDLIRQSMAEERNKKDKDLIIKQLSREEIYAQMRTEKFKKEVLNIMTEYIDATQKLAKIKGK